MPSILDAVNAYRNLDGTKVAATVSCLRERIESRFGADRGLARVASELGTLHGPARVARTFAQPPS